ncbi:uncharacterized protein B0H18DRAFT_652790 [Fomitopsis serialis]|uniref:uncharacterized protein n=1 Tax=Fomitopsis serialis TaxID=139415 RepID=UPI0020085A5A|nr:uncharacterized protein B0H18DRAFT_652790 [Neoantrodia serialis]KAH9919259.1 hypothetical protein B0H18DRAFT_652790 [Neoantrodia serialis]
MMLRWPLLKERRTKLRKLQPILPSQMSARNSLFDSVLGIGRLGKGVTDAQLVEMRHRVHVLASSILHADLDETQIVCGAVDIVSVIATLRPEGGWNPNPNAVTAVCSAWQFVLRSISLHDARLTSQKKVLYEAPSCTVACDDIGEDEDDDLDIVEEDGGNAAEVDGESDEGEAEAEVQAADQSLLQCIYDNARWTSPLRVGQSTSYNRMKTAHSLVHLAALAFPSKTRFSWSMDGQTATMSSVASGSQAIPISSLCGAAGHATAELRASLDRLLQACGLSFSDLMPPDDLLADSTIDPTSFLDSPNFTSRFRPLEDSGIANLWNAIHAGRGDSAYDDDDVRDDSADRDTTLRNFLKEDYIFLQLLSTTALLTCGNPPRGFQLAEMRYRAYQGSLRNLYLMSHAAVLCCPRAKGVAGATQASLWALTHQTSQVLIVYLSIVRPIITRLLKDRGFPCEVLQTHLFVTSSLSNKALVHASWTTADLNVALGKVLLDSGAKFKISVHNLRQLIPSIVARHLPQLAQDNNYLQGSRSSVFNSMAGHTNQTAAVNYGINQATQHTGFNISSVIGEQHLIISQVWLRQLLQRINHCSLFLQAWQSFMCVADLPAELQDMFPRSSEAELRRRQWMALDRARILVYTQYLRGMQGDAALIKQEIGRLLSTHPFMQDDDQGSVSRQLMH